MSREYEAPDFADDDCAIPASGSKKAVNRAGLIEAETEMAAALENAYTTERRSWELRTKGRVSYYQPSQKHKHRLDCFENEVVEDVASVNFWAKTARSLYESKIDPVAYVRKIFQALNGTSATPPEPSQLLSRMAEKLYAEAIKNTGSCLRIAFEGQKATMRTKLYSIVGNEGVSEDEAVARILYDIDLPLSALFRYCAALRENRRGCFKALLKLLIEPASRQYVQSQEHYDEIWGDFIPAKFKKDALEQYRLLLHPEEDNYVEDR